NAGTDLTVITGAGSTVSGTNGIYAHNEGSGAVEITANGDVTGTAARGIDTNNSSYGTNLSITTGTSSAVMGDTQGVYALNYGSGALSITANGEVTGITEHGIYASARGTDGTGFTVTTGSSSTVSGGSDGIYARNRTFGALEVTANGDVDGDTGAGIRAVSDG